MCEARRTQTRSPCLALPSPGSKSGSFYFAGKRNFLLCLDRPKAAGGEGPRPFFTC